ncbi:MAG: DUF1559 domain-containing protein [Phycisphaerales bacterium]
MCRARRAFTLIELLVVIAIIALLIGILLPSLATAREKARQAKCNINLRSFMQACHQYANDFDDRLPASNWALNGNGLSYGWLYAGGLRQTYDARNYGASTGFLWPYLGGDTGPVVNGGEQPPAETYRCPSHHEPYDEGPAEKITSYQMNGGVIGYGRSLVDRWYHVGFRIQDFRPTSVIFWETQHEHWNDGSSFPTEGQTERHGDGSTLALVDGACRWTTRAEWARQLDEMPGPLWCAPDTDDGN